MSKPVEKRGPESLRKRQLQIIDSHVHLRGEDISPDEFRSWSIQYGEALGTSYQIALIPFGKTWDRSPGKEEVAECHRILDKYLKTCPESFYGWAYVNPIDTQFSLEEIRRWVKDGPFVGVKLWVSRKCSDKEVNPILKAAEDWHFPILQHAWDKSVGLLPHESLPSDVAEAAGQFPNCQIIMAHLGGFWQKALKEVAPYSNVSVDCSGGWAMTNAIEKAVRLLGEDRVVYGSDAPLRDIPTQLGKVLGARISDTAKAKILSGNFLRATGRES